MSNNNIFLDFKLSKSKLGQFLREQIDMPAQNKLQVDGFDIRLGSVKNENIHISVRQKTILADVPLAFTFIKSAGLFSIEGEGSIRIHLEMTVDFDQKFGLHTKSVLQHYEWIKDPVLHLGELNIPIESLSNCIINFMKENTLEKMDTSARKLVDIKKIIQEQIQNLGYNYPIHAKPDLFLNVQLLHVQSDVFHEDEDNIHLDIWVEVISKITDEQVKFEIKSDPDFYWIDKIPEKNNHKIEAELTYFGIARALINEFKGLEIGGKTFELESIHIRKTATLEIKACLLAPIKGIITVTCNPYLNQEEQKLYADDVQIDVDATNFIYKISSPIIEKIIRAKINALLPFDPAPFFADFIKKIPSASLWDNQLSFYPKVNQIILENLSFNEQHLMCTVLLTDAELGIVI
jgi:Domain of unknown function (DUF4403)